MSEAVRIVSLLLLGAATYYAWFIIRIIRGLAAIRPPAPPSAPPSVTVIIPARNEELHIERCVRSVLAQDYPHDRFEVIVVDDTSEDSTAEIVRTIQQQEPRVRLLSLPPRENLRTGRKPEAVAMGVSHARGEISLSTDADCTHPSGWVRTMVSYFTPETALVAGPVAHDTQDRLFAKIERLDFMGIMTSAAGLIGAGRPMICSGANLAYRTDAYIRASRATQISSNDDGTLMNRIVTRGIGSVGYALHPAALVHTPATGSPVRYFRQRMRWAAVRGRFLDKSIYVELAILYPFFPLLAGCTLAAPFMPGLLPPVAAAWLIKAVVDWTALSRAAHALAFPFSLSVYLLAQAFHPFAILIATLLSVVMPFSWKGRRLTR